jgi:hypothetical protein
VPAGQPIQIIFCADPLNGRRPDPAYASEVAAAEELEIEYHLVSFEDLVENQAPSRAVRRVPEASSPVLALYRGWMLRPARYADLFYQPWQAAASA